MSVMTGEFEGGEVEEITPDVIPVPVHILRSDTTPPTRVAEYGSGVSWPVPLIGTGNGYVQILQRNINRQRAIVRNPLTTAATLTNTGGQQTDPPAGTTLASLALPAGQYVVNWTVGISGTLSTNDTGNFSLNAPGFIAASNNPEALGSFPQPPQTIIVPVGGTTVTIKNFAQPSNLATVYLATLTVQSQGNIIVISSNLQGVQQGLGFQMEPGTQQQLENQQPWYAAGLTGAGILNVLDERWEYE
jgi:hypothetical protein